MGEALLLSAETEGTAMTMATLLSTVGDVLAKAILWVGSIGTTITSTPILLLGTILFFVGFGVGLFRRLLHV